MALLRESCLWLALAAAREGACPAAVTCKCLFDVGTAQAGAVSQLMRYRVNQDDCELTSQASLNYVD